MAKDKASGMNLAEASIQELLDLSAAIKTELQGRYDEEAAKLRELQMMLGIGAPAKAEGGKRTRASAAEIAERRQAILNALKGTTKDKGLSKSEIAEKAGLDVAACQQALMKLKAEKEVKMNGTKGNATYFLG